MKVIADSSSTRTEWALVDGTDIIASAVTTGLNPYFQTRREISHSIRLELPERFFRRRWDHIYFYGSGCANPQKNKIIESSIIAQFRTPVTVMSNLTGAARGLLVDREGLACILGTGSNSCHYNGKEIISTVRPLGFILGDEGSNAHLGKQLISNILKGLAPKEISEAFYSMFDTTPDAIMYDVYTQSFPSRSLAKYSFFLAEHISHDYAHDLVYNSFMAFFKRNISFYDYKHIPLSFVGSTATLYEPILRQAAADFGATIQKIAPTSMPGLIQYHARD